MLYFNKLKALRLTTLLSILKVFNTLWDTYKFRIKKEEYLGFNCVAGN